MIILFCGAEAHNDELIREATSRLHQFRLVDVTDKHAVGTSSAPHGSMPRGHNLEPIVLAHSTSELAQALTAVYHDDSSNDEGHSSSNPPDNQPPTVIIPMTAGRDLHSITALAQAIQWWKRSRPSARVIISDPIGNSTTRVSALRANMRSHPAHSYVVGSVALDPFFDADLFRDARLAWQYSTSETSVAFDGASPSLPEAIHRAEILLEDQLSNQASESGVERIVVLRADLLPPNKDGYQTDGQSYHEVSLWSPSALAVLIETNVVRARDAAADVFKSSAENDAAHGIDGSQSSDDRHHARVASSSPSWGWMRHCGLIMIRASHIVMPMMRMIPRAGIAIRIHTTTPTPISTRIRIPMAMPTTIMSGLPIPTTTHTTTSTGAKRIRLRAVRTINRPAITRTS